MEILSRAGREWLTVTALLLVARPALPIDPPRHAEEYRVKAAFIYTLARFTSWPEEAHNGSEIFTLCILGDDPFGQGIEKVIADKRLSGAPVRVVRRHEIDPVRACHVVFIST